MTTRVCPRCGQVHFGEEGVCRACGASLGPPPTRLVSTLEEPPTEDPPRPPRTTHWVVSNGPSVLPRYAPSPFDALFHRGAWRRSPLFWVLLVLALLVVAGTVARFTYSPPPPPNYCLAGAISCHRIWTGDTLCGTGHCVIWQDGLTVPGKAGTSSRVSVTLETSPACPSSEMSCSTDLTNSTQLGPTGLWCDLLNDSSSCTATGTMFAGFYVISFILSSQNISVAGYEVTVNVVDLGPA
ncbi:MAG: hypothetical protein KGJ23_09935 [Euryarchaeota archaeon]|nr:hypothetical protein [Euryarchaeota archaeon]MDE1836923.1 hypothetical protein [Euryarchaeota archaeon]MDE2045092.1 hypothetical protein [Thermoplasmata archaeon]